MLKILHVVASEKISPFLWLNNILLYHIFFPFIDGHLGGFHILTNMNNAMINMEVYISHRNLVFIFFDYIPIKGIAGSYGRSF